MQRHARVAARRKTVARRICPPADTTLTCVGSDDPSAAGSLHRRIEAGRRRHGRGVQGPATPSSSRTVAIKVLPPDKVVDADRKRRFVQEARAASALNHPNIVTVHDIGTDGDTDFIVMEYVAGTTLDRLFRPHGLPVKQALGFAVEIAARWRRRTRRASSIAT